MNGVYDKALDERTRIESVMTTSILDKRASGWGNACSLHTPLRADFLAATEASQPNNIATYYLSFHEFGRAIGHANVFVSDTDFSTFDSKLSATNRLTIKRWLPQFMQFRIVENGFFTMIGEGHVVASNEDLPQVLRRLDRDMQAIAREEKGDFLLIRDIPIDKFEQYHQVLQPLGYYPTLGFSNTVLPLPWRSLDEYFDCLTSKTRNKLRKSLDLQSFGIETEFRSDFASIAQELAGLWRNVNERAQEYSREQLDEKFFRACSGHLPRNAEVLLFKHQGKIIAFMLNLMGDDDYIVLDWGVDYGFEDYKKANLYRAATVLSVERAIALGKSRLELGITNYTPKMTLGAEVVPLVYFVRHVKQRAYSKTLAKILSDNIVQPDNRLHDSMQKTGVTLHDIPAAEAKIKAAQDEYAADDFFNRVGRAFRADSMRLAGIYGLYPEFNCAQQSSVTFSDDRPIVLLGTNSYLGAANHPEVVRAAQAALTKYGSGCSGSPLLNGTLDIHNKLEQEIAQFMNREAVALCSTGYQTNLAALSALCAPGDAVLMDSRNHRSLFDGVRLSGADCLVYRHADLSHLQKMLARLKGRRKLIVTDSLFSMEGVVADLGGICELAQRYGARVFVDESHAVGVLGPLGRGVCELQGVEDAVDIIMGTFSKSFAALGGFIAGRADVIDFIKHTAGGHIFSASLPASVIETVRAVLRLIQHEPDRRTQILDKARYMADELQKMGYRAVFGGSQIVPVIFGNYTLSLAAYKRFMDQGVYVNPVGPPAVPEEASGFRTSYMAAHRWQDLDLALEVFRRHANDFAVA